MSSSSTPEPPGDEAARLALDEVEEAEAILEQRSPKAETALGDGPRGWSWRRLGDGGAGGAGAPVDRLLPDRAARDHHPRQLLDVVTDAGFERTWTLGELQRALPRLDLLGQHALDVRDVGDRGGGVPRARVPGRVLPRAQGREPAHPDRALHHRAGPVLDELPHPRDCMDVPADGSRGSPEPGAHQAADHLRAGPGVRLLDALGAAGDDPALHPVHDHAALLLAGAGRSLTRSRRRATSAATGGGRSGK